MPNNKDDDKHEKEYAVLLALFKKLIKAIKDNDGQWEALEELMAARAKIGIEHAVLGFGMTWDDFVELMEKESFESGEDGMIGKREIMEAAVDNICDFAVAEEYQMADEFPDFTEAIEEGELDEDEVAELMSIFHKYNHTYAWTENMDIEYALIMALHLYNIKDDTVLMYMTQGDERVRPWHLQYEGFTAPKRSFPEWLIPPIEHQCRCFLVEDSDATVAKIQDAVYSTPSIPEMPEWFNPTFKESVAMGGRIFSDEHPYFQIDDEHLSKLREIAKRIKSTYIKRWR